MATNELTLEGVIDHLAERFAQSFAKALARNIGTISETTAPTAKPKLALPAAAKVKKGIQKATLCYYPGCKNTGAPRYRMFCAALHKDLSIKEKEKYKALHDKTA